MSKIPAALLVIMIAVTAAIAQTSAIGPKADVGDGSSGSQLSAVGEEHAALLAAGLGAIATSADDDENVEWRVQVVSSFKGTDSKQLKWREGHDYLVLAKNEGEATTKAYAKARKYTPPFSEITNLVATVVEKEGECEAWKAEITRYYKKRYGDGAVWSDPATIGLSTANEENATKKARNSWVKPPIGSDQSGDIKVHAVAKATKEHAKALLAISSNPIRVSRAIFVCPEAAFDDPRLAAITLLQSRWNVDTKDGEEERAGTVADPALITCDSAAGGILVTQLFDMWREDVLDLHSWVATDIGPRAPLRSSTSGSFGDADVVEWTLTTHVSVADQHADATRFWTKVTAHRSQNTVAWVNYGTNRTTWLLPIMPRTDEAAGASQPAILVVFTIFREEPDSAQAEGER